MSLLMSVAAFFRTNLYASTSYTGPPPSTRHHFLNDITSLSCSSTWVDRVGQFRCRGVPADPALQVSHPPTPAASPLPSDPALDLSFMALASETSPSSEPPTCTSSSCEIPPDPSITSSMIAFLGSVIVPPLMEPVISTLQGSLLGTFAPVTHLAAMGPASLILLISVYSFTGVGVQALSDSSAARGRGDDKMASTLLSSSLLLGALWGIGMASLLFFTGPTLLTFLIKDPGVFDLSLNFLRIKVLAVPAILSGFVCNSAHLAQKKQKRALQIALLGNLCLSIVLEIFFIGYMRWGVTGAAMTTVCVQYVILAMQMSSLRQLEKQGGLSVHPKHASWTCTVGTLKRLGPLSAMYLFKTSAYCVISTSAALFGTIPAAIHQAMWPIYVLCSSLNTPCEVLALTFVPTAKTDEERQETIRTLKYIALGLSSAAAIIFTTIAIGAPWLLTKEQSLWPAFRTLAPIGAATLIVTGPDIASGGLLLSENRGLWYAQIMGVALVVTCLGARATHIFGLGLVGTWMTMFAYLLTRFLGTTMTVTLTSNDPWKLLSRGKTTKLV